MDFARRRTLLTAATLLALAIAAVAGGGVTFGLLSDEERSDVAIRAASDFAESPSAGEVVSFRGCGEVRLRIPENTSFSLTVTLYDSAADAREIVTLTDASAGSAASGFWYDSGRNQYRFDAGAYDGSNPEGDKIVAAELDGQLVENDHRCAAAGTGAKGGTGAQDGPGSRGGAGASVATTTAGNTATETVGGSGTGDGDRGSDAAGDDASAPNETEAPTATESSAPAESSTATKTSTPAETSTARETTPTATETTTSSPAGTSSTPDATELTTGEES